MRIDQLVIEITRRCNVKCVHCLRGDAQKINIADETIDALLEGIDSISIVTFSGGEPSLAVDKIRYFTQAVKRNNISVSSFYVVTNGKRASVKLVEALQELYDYCDDNELSSLCISGDQYHYSEIDSIDRAYNLYSNLEFFHPEERQGEIENYLIINEGRAVTNGLGVREIRLNDLILETDDEGNIDYVDGTVYVNALGDVCSSCDLSYESQEKEKIGSVLTDSLPNIISKQEV